MSSDNSGSAIQGDVGEVVEIAHQYIPASADRVIKTISAMIAAKLAASSSIELALAHAASSSIDL
eukprot:CAMPEP_0174887974 /NCGR_PEP_ID=MMETSP0167-20121228/3221_1 /TAXON_ID=38298 /ORGANISM="Rhodella maculata, Strain CCMP736" /LENGTH=64 /DNA_ID=CAMNT_0016124721 /DNA_START=195 /DNA_END=386 /DNA_ORIENTATION=-